MNSLAYDIPLFSIDGKYDVMSSLKGKVSLITNISSKLGYTPQCSVTWSYARTCKYLWELQQVHDMFKERGFSVVGIPCNQFGKMEPKENLEIQEFIKKAYPFVTFPITEKIEVNGKNEHPLYDFLKGAQKRAYSDTAADGTEAAAAGQNLAGQAIARIPHNYEKFLVSREGIMVSRFNWQDGPLDEEPRIMGAGWTITEAIDELLG
jgi:glutathione peroxidase